MQVNCLVCFSGSSFGRLGVPSEQKWRELFSQCCEDLGFKTNSGQSENPNEVVEKWQKLVTGLSARVQNEECLRYGCRGVG